MLLPIDIDRFLTFCSEMNSLKRQDNEQKRYIVGLDISGGCIIPVYLRFVPKIVFTNR